METATLKPEPQIKTIDIMSAIKPRVNAAPQPKPVGDLLKSVQNPTPKPQTPDIALKPQNPQTQTPTQNSAPKPQNPLKNAQAPAQTVAPKPQNPLKNAQTPAQNIAPKPQTPTQSTAPKPNPAPKPQTPTQTAPKPQNPLKNAQAPATPQKQESPKQESPKQESPKPQASQAPKPSNPLQKPQESKPDDAMQGTNTVMEDFASEVQGAHGNTDDKTAEISKLINPNIDSLKVDVKRLDFAITRKVRVYLKKLIDMGGSDLHIKAGSKIRARVNGDIVIFSNDIFSKEDAITFAKELTRTRYPEFVQSKEMDMTYIYDATNRFRLNIFFQMDGVSFAFRTIPTIHNTIEGLGLPDAIHKIVDMERGLVLVTGITGSGKSTTLAAIINAINHKHAKHIITIEDPIEFVHKDARSIINQRSVGMDTNSFANALKASLREDPDIILVGEMRDIETIEMALHAAETGHLVFSTLHTLDAKETINRVISVFPSSDQHRIRAMLANTLNAVISQRLLKNKQGGRVAAVELLFKTPRIEVIIAEGRDGEIVEALVEGKDIYKTQTFDQHLFELIINGVVDEETAMEKATSPSDLKLKLQNINFAESGESGTREEITLKR